MNEFLGIKNVTGAEAIIGKDGCVDGFKVNYLETREYYRGKKKFVKNVEKQKTVYVRDYIPENDGRTHGFGNPTVYVHHRVKKGLSKEALNTVSKIIGKRARWYFLDKNQTNKSSKRV